MTHDFLILHFAGQCPWLTWTVEQARTAATEVGGDVTVVDVAARPDLAERYQLYFPFLTIIDGRLRVAAPTSAASLVRLVRGEAAPAGEQSEPPLPTDDAPAQSVSPLTLTNLTDSCALCGAPSGSGNRQKCDWAQHLAPSLPGAAFGYVAYIGQTPVAAAEALPARSVPYYLPEADADTTFITCIYPTRTPDYRGAALARLLAELPRAGFDRVQVVAGRRTPFPNGPVEFFARHGFRELRTLALEQLREGSGELVLMERCLRC